MANRFQWVPNVLNYVLLCYICHFNADEMNNEK